MGNTHSPPKSVYLDERRLTDQQRLVSFAAREPEQPDDDDGLNKSVPELVYQNHSQSAGASCNQLQIYANQVQMLKNAEIEPIVSISVSGKIFQVLTRHFSAENTYVITSQYGRIGTLEKLMRCEHEQRIKICDYYIPETKTYFFDRDPQVFACVLQYYRNGQLHAPTGVCPDLYLDELYFWNISCSKLAECCGRAIFGSSFEVELPPGQPLPAKSINGSAIDLERGDAVDLTEVGKPLGQSHRSLNSTVPNGTTASVAGTSTVGEEAFQNVCLGNVRRVMYRITEVPQSGTLAKVYAAFSTGAVLLSVIVMIIASLPKFQISSSEYNDEFDHSPFMQDPSNPDERVALPVFQQLEIICIIWFTLEFVIRFLISPCRLKFLQQPLNIIDILSVAPFHIELIVKLVFGQHTFDQIDNIQGALLVLRILRVLRVMRIFKLARYSGGIASLGSTIGNSVREIGMLCSFLGITIILYSTTVYYLEKDEKNSKFISIPDTFWWCIVTMTTVGYGDMVPTTAGGKMVATLTSISGVIVLAFPITLIVENFNRTYKPSRVEPKKYASVAGAGRRPPTRRSESPKINVVRMF